MKNLFIICLFVFLFSIYFTNAQIGRPFNNCYPNDSCKGLVTTGTFTFPFMNCNVEVSFKKYYYNCPVPTTYIDIEYLRISLDCEDLICWLQPGPPFPCEDNPTNISNYAILERLMYENLVKTFFFLTVPRADCPNTYRYVYFHVAQCIHVCTYKAQRPGPYPDLSMIYMTESCTDSMFGCCGTSYEVCYENGVIMTYPSSLIDPSECTEGPFGFNFCSYYLGGTIPIGNENWTVLSASSTNCVPYCGQ